ncbi:DUF2637 domain-containing protein [Streptomyces sp. NPDC058644]|uniref:DUF2637 domain-containing protein n=1 Tax=unclassified Streptomyces TaxID=2593676 RepID=UPI003648AE20
MDTTRTRLTIAAGAAIIALTAAAFWLSYAHLHDVAAENGLGGSPARAWAWPATLDLFIVAGEIMMLAAALDKRRDAWAIGLTVAGSVGSVGLNVYGVGTDALLIEYIVAAVPPAAALLAFGALMRQIHAAIAEPAQTDEESGDLTGTPIVGAGSVEARLLEVPAEYAAAVDGMVERLAKESGTPIEFLKPTQADAERAQESISRLAADMEAIQAGAGHPQTFTFGAPLADIVEELEDEDCAFENEPEEAPKETTEEPEGVLEVIPPRANVAPSAADVAAAVEAIRLKGERVNGRAMAEYFGVSDRSGRRYLSSLQTV